MCVEITTAALVNASLAATAAGTGMQIAAQQKAKKAMSEAAALESGRQKTYRDQADAVFQESLGTAGAGVTGTKEADAGASREAAYKAAQAAAPTVSVAGTQGGTSKIVQDSAARENAIAGAKAGNAAHREAVLKGFGDVGIGTAIEQARSRQAAGQIGGFSKGSLDANRAELDYASHKGDSLNSWGQGISAAGTLASLGATMGFGAAADAAAAEAAKTAAAASTYGAGSEAVKQGVGYTVSTPIPGSTLASAANQTPVMSTSWIPEADFLAKTPNNWANQLSWYNRPFFGLGSAAGTADYYNKLHQIGVGSALAGHPKIR
ncbi:hypothetical protein UFOVP1325_39 [uncultured Caudovirales phage]|uniref:Uncharacterized protein n=1 Tax=uncultured Caudovirales phage TaxID=2100421 RepID=A0A6J7XDR5_9CAUD|nr:hypothetical protein UFOVP1325_39 [uncultured Caudovirales phage]CAB4212758.1 hypothetical protein UFOVP1435_32 [uncultured Caudovirales phage]CAB5227959.1 hypothetical protein UFOVP1530_22 [uncultured Caudovirales phage]